MQVGQILSYSWGYDQTNIEFFKVVKATAKSAWLEPLAATVKETGFMSGLTEPVVPHQRASHCSVTLKGPKRISTGWKGDEIVSMPHGVATLWDGEAERCSWYA